MRTRLDGLIFGVTMLLVFLMAARTPLESDLWWHLRAGQETLAQGQPLLVDRFSHTRYDTPWVNHSWLSQVGLALAFQGAGFFGLGLLVAGLATLSMALVYLQMDAPGWVRAFVIILAGTVAAPVWSARPQLVSLVMFAGLGLLLRSMAGGRGKPWLLIPLLILWSNLHGGYVLALLLIGAWIAGEAFDRLLQRPFEAGLSLRQIGMLAIWAALGGAAVAINPNGIAMWAIPFQTVGVSVLQEFISEWASPDFHQIAQQPFIWLLLATLAAIGLSGKQARGRDLAALGLFAYLALVARRNFGPFALAAAPVLAEHAAAAIQAHQGALRAGLQPLFEAFPFFRRRSTPLPERLAGLLNGLIVFALALGGLAKLYLVTEPDWMSQTLAKQFPAQAVTWLRANPSPPNMFNSYNWGGYLIWQLPQAPVFVDGRTDLYNDALLREYLQAVTAEPGWQQILEAYAIQTVLIEPQSGLARALITEPGWLLAYQDELAVVFVRSPGVAARIPGPP
jgi:hypothetical protein